MAAFAGAPLAQAGKKSIKRSKRERHACNDAVAVYCGQFGAGEAECLSLLTPCCTTCNAGTAVDCILGTLQET
jgi:hypothetical protein